MNQKTSPAPWHVEPKKYEHCDGLYVVSAEPIEKYVSEVPGHLSGGPKGTVAAVMGTGRADLHERRRADAALISAAPDLVNALAALIKALEPRFMRTGASQSEEDAIKLCRAAMKKAAGEVA